VLKKKDPDCKPNNYKSRFRNPKSNESKQTWIRIQFPNTGLERGVKVAKSVSCVWAEVAKLANSVFCVCKAVGFQFLCLDKGGKAGKLVFFCTGQGWSSWQKSFLVWVEVANLVNQFPYLDMGWLGKGSKAVISVFRA
jgi:hypothetical protein